MEGYGARGCTNDWRAWRKILNGSLKNDTRNMRIPGTWVNVKSMLSYRNHFRKFLAHSKNKDFFEFLEENFLKINLPLEKPTT